MSGRINALANLFLITLLIFFIALLLYVVRRSEYYPPGTMNKFYPVFITGILLCSFALKLRQDYKINFVLTILSIAIGVYFFEFYLSCCVELQPTNLYAQAARAAGVPFDTRTKQQAFLDLMEEGIEAYPSADVAQFIGSDGIELDGGQIFPLGGISQKKTLACNESGEYVIYQADEHGFNNPAGLYTGEDVDIVLIGDSFAHGYCVSAGQDIASQLRKMGKTTINLGYGGDGPLIELATLKEYAEPLKPKVILWLYYEGNDLEDLAVEQQSATFLSYLDRDFSQNLFNRQPEVDRALASTLEKKIAEIEKKGTEDALFSLNSQLTKIIRLYHLREMFNRFFAAPSSPPPSPLFEKVLKEAKDRTSAWGGTLYFVYLPAWQRYATDVDQRNLFQRDQVLSTVANLGIPLIDIHEVFIQHPDPLSFFPFRLHGHYVAAGYELVASTIKTYLEAGIDYTSTN